MAAADFSKVVDVVARKANSNGRAVRPVNKANGQDLRQRDVKRLIGVKFRTVQHLEGDGQVIFSARSH